MTWVHASSTSLSVVVQQGDTGVVLVDRDRDKGLLNLKRGDRVSIRGLIKPSRELPADVSVASVELLGAGIEPIPDDIMVRDLRGRRYLHALVRLSGVVSASGTGDRSPFVLRDRTGEIPLEIRTLLGSRKTLKGLADSSRADIVGIVNYRTGPDGTVYASLRPREAADFVFAPDPPYKAILAGAVLILITSAVFYIAVWIRSMRRHALQLTNLTGELRQSEAALQLRERHYRSVTETVPDAIITIDSGSRIRFSNSATETVLGWTPAELRDKSFGSLVDSCMPGCEGDCILVGGRVEASMVRKDGGKIEVEISANAMPNDAQTTVVIHDITERKQAENEIRNMNAALRRLTHQLLQSQDSERRRIARELHDGTSQNLAALKMNLTLLENPAALSPDARRNLVLESTALVDQSSREIRSLSYLLHPPLIEEFGLQSALRKYIDGFGRRTGIEMCFDEPETTVRLMPEAELALFRIAQEALANVQRHSRSKRAAVHLSWTDSHVELEIRDAGVGTSTDDSVSFGVGLLGMRERARWLNGSVDFHSGANGTTVLVRLPLDRNLAIPAEPSCDTGLGQPAGTPVEARP